MFLLRRIEDGKFWRNRSFKSFRDDKWDADWLSDPSLCKPFITKAAAMQSRGVGYPRPWQAGIHLNHTERTNRLDKWRAKFECVPVRIKVEMI